MINTVKRVLLPNLYTLDREEVVITVSQLDSSSINCILLPIAGYDVVTNKFDSPIMATVYHALIVAARNIDNADYA